MSGRGLPPMLKPAAEDPLYGLTGLIDGYQTTALLHAALALGLPDRLHEGEGHPETLAAGIGADPDRLRRLLETLVALHIVDRADDGHYILSDAGRALTSASRSGMRQRLELAVRHYAAVWAQMADGLRAGPTAFERCHGCSPWAHRQQHPEIGSLFNDWLCCETLRVARLIAPSLNLSGTEQVVDVGGGTGALLEVLLENHPQLQATLFDQPHVIAEARSRWQRAGRQQIPVTCGGDFMREIPLAADVFVLKSVLHDWQDETVIRILRVCLASMQPGARLLIIERLLAEDPTEAPATFLLDMSMMLVTGGRERSFRQFAGLLATAGFKVQGQRSTLSGFFIIEALAP